MPRNRFENPIGLRKNIAQKTQLMLANESNEFFLQLWNEAGDILSKSENLGGEQLSYLGDLIHPVTYDSEVANLLRDLKFK